MKVKSNSALSGKIALAKLNTRISQIEAKSSLQPQTMYQLFLLDYSMPEMDGIEVCKEVRRIITEKNLPQPTICCCSAYVDQNF